MYMIVTVMIAGIIKTCTNNWCRLKMLLFFPKITIQSLILLIVYTQYAETRLKHKTIFSTSRIFNT